MKRFQLQSSEQLMENHVERPCKLYADTEEDDELILALAASMKNLTTSTKITYPEVTKEPKVDKKLLCRIGPFQLTQAIAGVSKILDYEGKQTFEESGLANSMISFTWD
ncbi:hypothetical protein MKW98_008370 [Papaver atlanticum]|uniref:Uncharacterized protein n=1 Tax=Papaver atlanticum TaxID=357466 RepID=A0AAD4XDP9_9MAGN|nr:hypothetical protein MKW98_008370 [Papaver atlanticum]